MFSDAITFKGDWRGLGFLGGFIFFGHYYYAIKVKKKINFKTMCNLAPYFGNPDTNVLH